MNGNSPNPYPLVSHVKGAFMTGNQEDKYTILYGRLSDEDARSGRSLSIENQEKMLRAHAEKLNLPNPLFLYDDGITGTMDKRPGFQEALRMISSGEAGALIVTDLSRLYRNQASANNLMEVTLPQRKVRLISINDGYDSDTNTYTDEDLAMFLNLFNEYYPRVTSRKVNGVIHMKAEAGTRIGTIPPYGYQKHPTEKFKIVPDPEAAEVVRRIYVMCIMGLGTQQIANKLEKEQVLVPAEYAFRKFGREHSWRNPERPYEWSDGTVARILENEEYTGTQISCRTHKVSYKSDLVVAVPKEGQYRVENAHEAIIDRDTWEIVQRIRSQKRRPVKFGEIDLFSGMVFCADCGHVMHLSRCRNQDESKYTYVCGTYHGHKEECTPHTIKAVHLRRVVLSAIQNVCKQVREDRDWFVSRLLEQQSSRAKRELIAKRKALEQVKQRLTDLENLLSVAFEKLASGVLSDEAFQDLSGRYSREQAECREQIPSLEAELKEREESLENVDRFLEVVDRYLDIQELTPEVLHEFVDRIVVHERSERWKKKNYTQKIDIYFNYIGNLE